MTSAGRPPKPVRDGRPFRPFGRRLDHDQPRPRLVTPVEFRVNRPRIRLRISRDDTDARKLSAARNVCMGDDVTARRRRAEACKLAEQFRVVTPRNHRNPRQGSIVLLKQAGTA